MGAQPHFGVIDVHGSQVAPPHSVGKALEHRIPALLELDVKARRIQVAGVKRNPHPRLVLNVVYHVPAQSHGLKETTAAISKGLLGVTVTAWVLCQAQGQAAASALSLQKAVMAYWRSDCGPMHGAAQAQGSHKAIGKAPELLKGGPQCRALSGHVFQ